MLILPSPIDVGTFHWKPHGEEETSVDHLNRLDEASREAEFLSKVPENASFWAKAELQPIKQTIAAIFHAVLHR